VSIYGMGVSSCVNLWYGCVIMCQLMVWKCHVAIYGMGVACVKLSFYRLNTITWIVFDRFFEIWTQLFCGTE